jgi:O-antigen/teichoic acid export membrane protein
MTESLANDDPDAANSVYQTLIAGVLANALLACVLGFIFGLIFHLPGGGATGFPIMAAFLLAAAGFAFRVVSGAIDALLRATERFAAMAARQSVETLTAAVAAFAFGYWTRSPAAILLGAALGAAVGLVGNLLILRRSGGGFATRPRVDRRILWDLFLLNLKGLLHSFVNQAAGGLDRILLPMSGLSIVAVKNYALPYRLPETLSNLIAPAIDTTVPELTRQSATSQEGFAKSLDRYGLQALMVATALILVPSGWGGPFLRLWLGKMAPHEGGLVVLFIGFYFCLNFYLSTLTRAFRATGEMHFVVPFSGLNAVATLVFTIPAARYAGIVGVAAMNAAINGVQVVPFAYFLRLAASRSFPAGAHTLKALGVLALGSSAAVGCYFLSLTPVFVARPWLCLPAAPLAAGLMMLLLAYLKPAPLPAGLARFLPGVRR